MLDIRKPGFYSLEVFTASLPGEEIKTTITTPTTTVSYLKSMCGFYVEWSHDDADADADELAHQCRAIS